MLLVLDTRSNVTPKYSTNFFVIRRHYKQKDFIIDTTRHDASTTTPDPAHEGLPYVVHICTLVRPGLHATSGHHYLVRDIIVI